MTVAVDLLAASTSINSSTISITAISVVNIGLLLWLGSASVPAENRQVALWSHGLWSGMWLAWLMAWAATSFFSTPIPAVVLEDIGALLLVGCAVVRLWGMPGLRRYATISYIVFVLIDLVWPLATRFEWRLLTGAAQADVFLNTLVFAPSLCLVIFAMGLCGWSLLQLQVTPALRFTSALAAGGYALFQILIYQANLFSPGLPEANSLRWKGLTLTWRSFFVIVYWAELLNWNGIRVPTGRAQDWASKLSWLPPVIVTVVLEHYLK